METSNNLFIVEKLASIDPMMEGYQGSVYCFFCGELDINGKVIHSADCLWLEATQQTNSAAQPT